MDNGGEEDQDIKASTSASNDQRVSFTPLIKVVNSDPESGSGPDLETTNVKGLDNASDNTSGSSDSNSSSDNKDVHVSPQVSNADTQSFGNDKADLIDNASDSSDSKSSSDDKDDQVPPQILPQSEDSNNVCQSNADNQPFGNDKADVTNNASDSSDSDSSSDDKDVHVPSQVLPQSVEPNNACQSNADNRPFGSDKADATDNASDSSESNSSSDVKDADVPPQVLPQSVEPNNVCHSNVDNRPFGSDKADVTDNASDSSESNSSSDDKDADVPPQVLPQSEEPNNVGQSKAESTSQHSNSTCEPLSQNISPMMSPPIQVMKKHQQDSGSTMSKPSTPSRPLNWSVTSNESLFSIPIGNSSFSRGPVPTMDADLAKSEDLHKSEELSISGELFPAVHTRELPKSEEPCHSGELYKPMENFTRSDVTIQGVLASGNRTSSVSKEGETGLKYVPLSNTGSKKSSDGPTPTFSSSKSGANAQTSTRPEKKSCTWPLCWPAFCPAICCCSKFSKSCAWPSCLKNCFCKKGCYCFKCSAPSCKWFTCSSCSGKCCCCPGTSCWSFKCFAFSRNSCSCFSKCAFSRNSCSCFSKCWCSKSR